MSARSRRAGVLLAAAVTAAGLACGELSDLWTLRQALVEEYGEGSLHLSVEGGQRELRIGLEDPERLALSPAEQAALAFQVARYADGRYARRRAVDRYEVSFVEQKRWLLLFSVDRHTTYRFAPAELR